MDYSNTTVSQIIDCRDLLADIIQAYYFIESIKDAFENRWKEDPLVSHVSMFINEYDLKMKPLLNDLNTTLGEAYDSAMKEALMIESYKRNSLCQSDTVG
jgi:hypothetical protein